MSVEEQKTQRRRQLLLTYATCFMVLNLFFGLVMLYLRTPTGPSDNKRRTSEQEDHGEAAREMLDKATDLATCRSALQQLNQHLGEHADVRPKPLTAEQRDGLAKQFDLADDAIAELENGNFTLLDGQHLEFSLLLRDAALSLEVDEQPVPEKAAAAFAWVMRQVRLQERDGEPLPPSFILRRGWGTAPERSLVFLALLHQLGIDGCLVAAPAEVQGQYRYWACGAVADSGSSKDVYLFDPRLGLPLPGPKGEGVATLAAVRSQPELLAQLTVSEAYRYDVTPEDVQRSELHVACPLSSLSPRMHTLEHDLLAAKVKVRVATDPAALVARLQEAGGKDTPVRVWKPAVQVLRRYLPPEEGGSDKTTPLGRKALSEMNLVPMRNLPPLLTTLPGRPGQVVMNSFAYPFVSFLLHPQTPRDLMLRGRYREASPELVRLRDALRDQKAGLTADPMLEQQVRDWANEAIEVHAELARAQQAAAGPQGNNPAVQERLEAAQAQVGLLWKKGEQSVIKLVQGIAAEPRSADVIYLLALCMQEQAEGLQARLDRARREGQPVDDREVEAARSAWVNAASWWNTFATEHPTAPGAAAGRLQMARVREALGERDEAAALLERLANELTDLQKTACLYRAQRLKKKAS